MVLLYVKPSLSCIEYAHQVFVFSWLAEQYFKGSANLFPWLFKSIFNLICFSHFFSYFFFISVVVIQLKKKCHVYVCLFNFFIFFFLNIIFAWLFKFFLFIFFFFQHDKRNIFWAIYFTISIKRNLGNVTSLQIRSVLVV